MMTKVNLNTIANLIGWASGLVMSDEEVDELYSIDPNEEMKVKEVMVRFIVPQYNNYLPKLKTHLKEALKYYLNVDNEDYTNLIMGMNDPPFYFPTPIKNYFIWLWEVLYGDESYKIENLDEYIVDNKYGTMNYLE